MDIDSPGPPTDSEIIDRLGGTVAVANLCHCKPPSVSGWRNDGIPAARRQFLELLRPDVFRADFVPNEEEARARSALRDADGEEDRDHLSGAIDGMPCPDGDKDWKTVHGVEGDTRRSASA